MGKVKWMSGVAAGLVIATLSLTFADVIGDTRGIVLGLGAVAFAVLSLHER